MKPDNLLALDAESALVFMITTAERMGIKCGVMVIDVEIPGEDFPILKYYTYKSVVDEADPYRESDKGKNHYGVAMAMIAYMKAHRVNSGHAVIDGLRKGETHLRGGLRRDLHGLVVHVAFSGVPEVNNTMVAMSGLEMMERLINKYYENQAPD